MNPSLNVLTLSFLSAGAQGLFLSMTLLLHKRGNRKANRILAILVLAFSLCVINLIAHWTDYYFLFPHFASTASFYYLFGPLLYLYAQFLSTNMVIPKRRYFLHFLPFLIQVVCYAPLYALNSESEFEALKSYIFSQNPYCTFSLNHYTVHDFIHVPHMLFYTYLTVRLLHSSDVRSNNSLIPIERAKLDWLYKLTIGFAIFWSLWFLYFLEMVFGFTYYMNLEYLTVGSIVLLIYGISYMTLRHPEIFSNVTRLKNVTKYAKSTLSKTQADDYLNSLMRLMETEKPFLNSNLQLRDVARKLMIPSQHLSQIINERTNQNFYDFINQYRIEEVKRRLENPEHNRYTILSIAYETGFNSKSSFNAAFKKHAKMTPSQFKKSCRGLSMP